MNRNCDDQENEASAVVKRALLELQFYASSHTIHPAVGGNIHALASAGAIKEETLAFITNHCARFYGFNPAVTEYNIPVLEIVLVGRPDPVRWVGFADGHVERMPLDRRLFLG